MYVIALIDLRSSCIEWHCERISGGGHKKKPTALEVKEVIEKRECAITPPYYHFYMIYGLALLYNFGYSSIYRYYCI
jgi:hypothetical protein